MASPFAVFRRNRKAMIVALTVMVMFGFIFIPMLMDAMGTRHGTDPVIVSTARYGNLTQSQINQLVHRHARLVAFVRELGTAVMQAQGRGEEANKLLFHLRADESNPVPDVVRLWSLARYAQEIGMSVDNAAINDYLVQLTEKRVKPFVLDDILKRYSMRESELFELLRESLLSMGLVDAIVPSVAITTPGQRWDYFQRIRRQAKIELVPIPVKNYVGQVAEPNEAELKQFFEEHKKQPWPPSSPTPGFFQPAKVRLRYIKADLEEIAEKHVTEAEVLAQYEQDKERYDRQNRPRIDLGAPNEPKTPPSTPSAPTGGSATPAPADSPATGPGAAAPSDSDTPAKPPVSGEPSAADKQNGEAKPATESREMKEPDAASKNNGDAAAAAGDAMPPAKDNEPGKSESTSETPSTPGEKPSSAPATEESSFSRTQAPVRFASLADEPAAGGSEKTDGNESPKPSEPSADGGPKEPKTEDNAKKPGVSGVEPGKEQPSESPKPENGTSAGGANAMNGDEPKPAAAGSDQPAEPKTSVPETTVPPTGPTDEIKQQIRRELATRKIDELFQQVVRRLTQYRERRITEQGKVDPPDFEAWAKENNLVQINTDLLPEWELRKLELADALAESGGSFFETVFGQRLFVPTRGFDLRGSQFIWWPTEEAKPYTPKWDDEGVRKTVLDAWKLVKARDLAKQAADKLAAEARKAGKPLKEVFAGRADVEVLDPPEFTWMTAGSVAPLLSAGRLEVSAVGGVEWPGNEFMRTTFDLSPGESSVAMNQPRTFAYVIRVVDFTPSDNVLWESFTTLEYRHYAQIAANDMQAKLFGWFAQIQDAIGLKWERDYQDSPQE